MDDAARQFYVDLGKRITKIRKLKKMRQEDVAKMLGVTQSTFSQQVAGKSRPTAYQIWRIAEILSVSVLDLLPKSLINQGDPKCACCGKPDRHLTAMASNHGMVCVNCKLMIENAFNDPAKLKLGVKYLNKGQISI